MYKRLSAVMFPIVTLLFIGTALWGYQEYQAKNAVMLKAENHYQRAFHDLTYHVDKLHDELGQTLAVHANSKDMHRKGLANVWRLSSEAQNEINQLPLTLLPFEKTEDFLSRISNFSYRTSIRDMAKEPLTQDEVQTLKTLYANSEEISSDLKEIQKKVLTDTLRWSDAEMAMASENTNRGSSVVDGFRSVDSKVKEYPEINWGPSVTSMYTKRSLKMLSGEAVSEEALKKKAAKLMQPHEVKELTIRKNGNTSEYESFTVQAKHQDDNGDISIDFTKQGVVLSYVDTRSIAKKELTREEAVENAKQFIKRHQFGEMRAVRYQSHDGFENITFVPVKDNVYLYPMKVQIRVALDTGDIIGVQASDYVFGGLQMDKVKLQPKLSKQEAIEHIHTDMKISYDRLAVIMNEVSQPVLCYEFGGRMGKQAYRVYINAETGTEEVIETVTTS